MRKVQLLLGSAVEGRPPPLSPVTAMVPGKSITYVSRDLKNAGPPHLVAAALVLLAGVICLAPPSDPDLWWHLETGDFILDTGRLPRNDTWSLVASGRTWVAHEWLGEVFISLFNKAFGLPGVRFYRSLAVMAILTCLAVQAFRRATPHRALMCLTLAFFATIPGWGGRPQLISFLLMVAAAQLVRAAVAHRASPWWLVPLTWIWANVHAYWIMVVALLGVAVLGLLLRDTRRTSGHATRLGLVAAVCFASALLTPNGLGILDPFLATAGGDPSFIAEFRAPSIQSAYGLAFFVMLAAIFILYARSEDKIDPYDLAQVCFVSAFGLLYIRTIPPAAVLLLPLLADAFGRSAGTQTQRTGSPMLNLASIAVIAGAAAVGGWQSLTGLGPYARDAPVAATDSLLNSTVGVPRVINEYDVGGWLIRNAGDARPAIDGRAEIYPPGYVQDYIAALSMRGDWKATVARLQSNVALLRPETSLVNGLRDELGWVVVYNDDNWLVLVPPPGQ